VETFKKDFPRGLNVLINNAGINVDAENSQGAVERTLRVNYRGTLEVTHIISFFSLFLLEKNLKILWKKNCFSALKNLSIGIEN
jgi:short-subunit dehydrogenase involved in D-alanine esterification of teichoic acids